MVKEWNYFPKIPRMVLVSNLDGNLQETMFFVPKACKRPRLKDVEGKTKTKRPQSIWG
jgi:hypothetical protein